MYINIFIYIEQCTTLQVKEALHGAVKGLQVVVNHLTSKMCPNVYKYSHFIKSILKIKG
jgi:3-hydroxy-3-methylglutaryl CoA synthase